MENDHSRKAKFKRDKTITKMVAIMVIVIISAMIIIHIQIHRHMDANML